MARLNRNICTGRKCLKFINPETYPGVAWGKPWVKDLRNGCCVDCDNEAEREEERRKKENGKTK